MATMIITDEKGKKVSVIVPIKEYEKMIKSLEDAADERAYERAKRGPQIFIPAREAFKQIEENRKKRLKQ